jgi:hypothetical protein
MIGTNGIKKDRWPWHYGIGNCLVFIGWLVGLTRIMHSYSPFKLSFFDPFSYFPGPYFIQGNRMLCVMPGG